MEATTAHRRALSQPSPARGACRTRVLTAPRHPPYCSPPLPRNPHGGRSEGAGRGREGKGGAGKGGGAGEGGGGGEGAGTTKRDGEGGEEAGLMGLPVPGSRGFKDFFVIKILIKYT